jgi:uncharacterized protein YndB with AHSA1/START domain
VTKLIRTISIEIRAPAEKVWELLALDRWAEWDEGTQKLVKRVDYLSGIRAPEDKFRVGATANLIDKKDRVYLASEVIESLENAKLVYLLRADGHQFVHQISQTFTLEPVEGGTRLTLVMDYEKLGWGILGKAIIKSMTSGKGTEKQLENLKNILEK